MTGDWGTATPGAAAPDPTTPGAAVPGAAEHVATPARTPPPHRWGLGFALALALLAAAALGVSTWWLATARDAWESQNEELRAEVATLTDELSARNARLAELEEAQTQLETLKEQYSAAVNEGAAGSEIVEELEDIVAAYQRCVDAQADHFDVLRNADRYVPSSIVDSEASITQYCADVSLAYADFQASRG